MVTEREGRVHETDALKSALRFVTQLNHRMPTSTARCSGWTFSRATPSSSTHSPWFTPCCKTMNKVMARLRSERLLRNHTSSAVLVHGRPQHTHGLAVAYSRTY